MLGVVRQVVYEDNTSAIIPINDFVPTQSHPTLRYASLPYPDLPYPTMSCPALSYPAVHPSPSTPHPTPYCRRLWGDVGGGAAGHVR